MHLTNPANKDPFDFVVKKLRDVCKAAGPINLLKRKRNAQGYRAYKSLGEELERL